MKPLRWTTNSEKHAYMRMRQNQNKSRVLAAEDWAYGFLKQESGIAWTRQAAWGFRIFDFWNANLGCAVEIDGPEHDAGYDGYRDEYNFRSSGIIVLRIRNFDQESARIAIKRMRLLGTLSERKKAIAINGNSKSSRRWLSSLPYPPDLLSVFLDYGAEHMLVAAKIIARK